MSPLHSNSLASHICISFPLTWRRVAHQTHKSDLQISFGFFLHFFSLPLILCHCILAGCNASEDNGAHSGKYDKHLRQLKNADSGTKHKSNYRIPIEPLLIQWSALIAYYYLCVSAIYTGLDWRIDRFVIYKYASQISLPSTYFSLHCAVLVLSSCLRLLRFAFARFSPLLFCTPLAFAI